MPDPAKPPTGQPTDQQIWDALSNDPKSRRILAKEAKRFFPELKLPDVEAREEFENELAERDKQWQDRLAALEQQITTKQSTDSWEGAKDELRRKYGWSDKTIESFKADLEKEFANGQKPLGYTDLAEYWMMKRQALQPTGVTTITGRQMQADEQDLRAMLDDPKSPIFDETEKKKLFKANWEAAKQELAMRP